MTDKKTEGNTMKRQTTAVLRDVTARDICDIVQRAQAMAEKDDEFFDMVMPRHTEREYIERAIGEFNQDPIRLNHRVMYPNAEDR